MLQLDLVTVLYKMKKYVESNDFISLESEGGKSCYYILCFKQFQTSIKSSSMLHITAVFVVFEIIVANETHRHKCRLYKSATIGTLKEF